MLSADTGKIAALAVSDSILGLRHRMQGGSHLRHPFNLFSIAPNFPAKMDVNAEWQHNK